MPSWMSCCRALLLYSSSVDCCIAPLLYSSCCLLYSSCVDCCIALLLYSSCVDCCIIASCGENFFECCFSVMLIWCFLLEGCFRKAAPLADVFISMQCTLANDRLFSCSSLQCSVSRLYACLNIAQGQRWDHVGKCSTERKREKCRTLRDRIDTKFSSIST